MIEIVGGIARVVLSGLYEILAIADFPVGSRYREYRDTVPEGETPLSKRDWKAAGKPERYTTAEAV